MVLLKDLDKPIYSSIRGSISSYVTNYTKIHKNWEIEFEEWFSRKFPKGEDGKHTIYYALKDSEPFEAMDEELREDLKVNFKKRFEKRQKKLQEWEEKLIERQKGEAATDKQLEYAKKLYFDLYEKENNFDDKQYSKRDLVEIIGNLKKEIFRVKIEKIEKAQSEKSEEVKEAEKCKVIYFPGVKRID